MKNDKDAKMAKDLYNSHADSYFDNLNIYPAVISLRKEVTKLIENPKGKYILFAGCGDAEEARELIEKGAKVTGIDISDKCINLAKKKFPNQEFRVMDFEKTTFKDGNFDTIVAIFAVMYKASLASVLKEFKRLIKKDDCIIIVVPHPIRKMIKYNKMDYYVSGKQIEIWKGNKRFNYYRTMEEYINAITESGLKLDKIYEPRSPKENKDVPDIDTMHPHHLIIVARK
jgi:ubiquinone/menaquinone biosynthesis C-methylase UbiE